MIKQSCISEKYLSKLRYEHLKIIWEPQTLSIDSQCILYFHFILSDVNVENPDKKSIMMYLMCLFKVLPHSDIPPVDESDLPLSPTSPLSPETEITQSVSASFVESSRQSGVSAKVLDYK